jgi:hypothetical protein
LYYAYTRMRSRLFVLLRSLLRDKASKRHLYIPLPLVEEPLGLLELWERYIEEKQLEGGSAIEALRARHWLGRHRA